MTKFLLNESHANALVREGSVWLATLLTPGKGSSGTYGEDVIKRDAATTWPAGAKLFFKHPTEENFQRDPRDQWGYLTEAADGSSGSAKGKVAVLPHWQAVVDSLGEAGQANLSIWAMGESDSAGNITGLFPDIQNGIDMVAYPGRPGSALTQKMFESARAASGIRTESNPLEDDRKETKMTPEQEAKLDKLAALFESFVAESKIAAENAAKDAKDADAVKAEAETARVATIAALESIREANLPEALTANLVATVEAGRTDVAALIETAVKTVEDIKKQLGESASPEPRSRGRFVQETAEDKGRSDEFETLMGGGE
jgi:hypothetical protein